MKKVAFVFFLLIVTSLVSYAQLDKANKHFENREYGKAIEVYKNILKKGENLEALENIANSYRYLRDYAQAEGYFEQLIKKGNTASVNNLYYGLVLKANGKTDEAKEQFKAFAKIFPNDKKVELYIKSCDIQKSLEKKAKQYTVALDAKINSEFSEFCPVFYKDNLVFVSDISMPLSNELEKFYHVYFINIKNNSDKKKMEALPYPINMEYHDGPVNFNPEQNTIAITHVDVDKKRDKDFINRSKLYFSKLEGKKWSNRVPFQYNSDSYSVAHACYSADGKTLYFASDMPEGFGGMDIYYCSQEGEGWSKPQNLGSKINTAGDEVFPYYRKDEVFFFSSDGHAGFGGLDVFSATKNNESFSGVKNCGADINSSADDFGIVFADDITTGYLSSDRYSMGKGRDDIYKFTKLNNGITLAGKVLIGKNIDKPLKNTTLTLRSAETGEKLDEQKTNDDGSFIFEDLEPSKKYMVKLDGVKDEKQKYFLVNEDERFIRETGIDGKGGKFVFRNLPADNAEEIEIANDGLTIAGNLLVGSNSTKPLANAKVDIVNEKGEIVQSVVTNAFGSFVFTNLPPDNNYLVKVAESDLKLPPKTKIILTNKSGKEMQSSEISEKGTFTFSLLASEKNVLKQMEVEDIDLRVDFKGKFLGDNKTPLKNAIINLLNEKGEIIQSTKTDEFGTFRFENLPADQNVLLAVDENEPQLKKLKRVVLANSKGETIKEVNSQGQSFKFSMLPSEKKKLSTVYVDDPWLKVLKLKNSNKVTATQNITIVEKVYYNYGDYQVLPEAAKVLDKVVDLMEKDPLLVIELSSHTDSRSSKEFNLSLSQKRATAAVDYILKNGIVKERISGKGYGESKPINKCTDGVDCPEEEHAKNRRTEFQINRK
jgi:outer membrane protein OmpA-like peptidoglycan-associated protein/tetratricopeptide (TPR) repeat protein